MNEDDARKSIAFMPELKGSEAMEKLIQRIGAIANSSPRFADALNAVEESLAHRRRIIEGYAKDQFNTDLENVPPDADLGGILYRHKPKGGQ